MQALRVVARTESGAIGDLYKEHGRAVFRTAYRITGNADDAEDVLQTVFLRLVRQKELTAMNAGAYLRRAAVNAALDVLRHRRTARTVPIEMVDGIVEARGGEREPAELRRLLRRALAKLHPRTAETFALRFIEGWDNREIAQALGTSAAVVAVTVHRARALLRRDLGREYGPAVARK